MIVVVHAVGMGKTGAAVSFAESSLFDDMAVTNLELGLVVVGPVGPLYWEGKLGL
jgi:hypothetical protein